MGRSLRDGHSGFESSAGEFGRVTSLRLGSTLVLPAEAADWRPLYPFESRRSDLDGHRYHYIDEGEGEVLLLVHGNPTWSFYWRNLFAPGGQVSADRGGSYRMRA